ncbi:olfactory receptor 5G9-like [Rhinoderma darwinii]|uniref:olfactory receptor 5G9-like n=1 Tax=Rhinoderma darwinii TaxID=43563 RepID=UPI003F676D7F
MPGYSALFSQNSEQQTCKLVVEGDSVVALLDSGSLVTLFHVNSIAQQLGVQAAAIKAPVPVAPAIPPTTTPLRWTLNGVGHQNIDGQSLAQSEFFIVYTDTKACLCGQLCLIWLCLILEWDFLRCSTNHSCPYGLDIVPVQAMKEKNLTAFNEFFLLGFQVSQCLRIFLFCLLLVVYCGTICGNLLIITLVSTSKNLHTPMYFFISQLSISDILLPTNIVPKMLSILLNNGGTITFAGCITQFYFFCGSEIFECLLLTVMSYDRYLAICNPLSYNSIMTSVYCGKLSVVTWLLGFSFALTEAITISTLTFCGPNIIDHFFCDLLPLLEIPCSDTLFVQIEIFLLSIPSVFIPTTIIIFSYVNIVLAIIRIPLNSGRQKAFSTCSSHLTVVSIFYWTMFCVYIVPSKGQTLTVSKVLSLLYTIFTPMINPIIYSLRNKEIGKAVYDRIHKYIS